MLLLVKDTDAREETPLFARPTTRSSRRTRTLGSRHSLHHGDLGPCPPAYGPSADAPQARSPSPGDPPGCAAPSPGKPPRGPSPAGEDGRHPRSGPPGQRPPPELPSPPKLTIRDVNHLASRPPPPGRLRSPVLSLPLRPPFNVIDPDETTRKRKREVDGAHWLGRHAPDGRCGSSRRRLPVKRRLTGRWPDVMLAA